MKTLRQMIRQPLKTLSGIAMITLAVATLCVCVGQSFAAEATQRRLDQTFMSIALPTAEYNREVDEWAKQYAMEHPEIIKSVSTPGLVSAYIPALTPENYTAEYHRDYYLANYYTEPYQCAILEFTLLEEPQVYESVSQVYVKEGTVVLEDGQPVSLQIPRGQVWLRGRIDRVIGLQDGYADPIGFTIEVIWNLKEQEEIPQFTVGNRYLVYGKNYDFLDYNLRCSLTATKGWPFVGQLDEDALIPLTEKERQSFLRDAPTPAAAIVSKIRVDNSITGLRQDQVDAFRTVRVYAQELAASSKYQFCQNEQGEYYLEKVMERAWISEDGQRTSIDWQEYAARYPDITVVELQGTAEEWLASEEGTLWMQAYEDIQINSHSFPVIGVDPLNEIADFARSKAWINAGREFTVEELETGAKVCLISQTLAESGGLQVGDTISPRFYEMDPNLPYQIDILEGALSTNPTAYYYYGGSTGFVEDREPYTVIGIYQSESEWANGDSNPYGFGPNTIFVPKASVPCQMVYGYTEFYRMFTLQNGTIEQFQQAVVEAGWDGHFYLDDNGYGEVAESMDSYREGADRARTIGVMVYGIIILVFMVLYPVRQKEVLSTMTSLGACRRKRMAQVIGHGMAILLPGTILGVGVGALLWKRVVALLTENSAYSLEIRMELSVLGNIGVVQLVVAALMLLGLALFMSGGRNKRKRTA